MFRVDISVWLIATHVVGGMVGLEYKVTPIVNEDNCNEVVENPKGIVVIEHCYQSDKMYPWVVKIYNRLNPLNVHRCTGMVITKRHVLTTAWCLTTKIQKEIWRMQVHVEVDQDYLPPDTCNIYVHPNYDLTQDATGRIVRIENNIGIISLKTDFRTCIVAPSPHKFQCLARDRHYLLSTKDVRIMTWGYERSEDATSLRTEFPSNMKVKVLYNNITTAAPPEYFGVLGVDDNSAMCYGDDGAAVIAKLEDRWQMFGMLTWHFDFGHCSQINHRVVNVSYHADWIKDVTTQNDSCGQRIDTAFRDTYPDIKGITIH